MPPTMKSSKDHSFSGRLIYFFCNRRVFVQSEEGLRINFKSFVKITVPHLALNKNFMFPQLPKVCGRLKDIVHNPGTAHFYSCAHNQLMHFRLKQHILSLGDTFCLYNKSNTLMQCPESKNTQNKDAVCFLSQTKVQS